MLFHQDMSEDDMERFSAQKEALYREIYAPQRALLPGIERFLRALKAAGVPAAVATGSPPDNIPFIMDHFDLCKYFSAVVGAIEVKKGKPNPEIYLLAASRLGVAPEECLVFEDALLGIQAARSAGMQVIGIATTHEASELEGAELVAADFERLSLHGCEEPEVEGLQGKLFCIMSE